MASLPTTAGVAPLGSILCCLCGVPIAPNPAAMCATCVGQEYDLTAGIPRNGSVTTCRSCGRWETQSHQWVRAERESAELLALCLRKVGAGAWGRGSRGHLRLQDAGWVWTEPHARRLKLWVAVEGEADSGTRLRQRVVVELKELWRQCNECSRAFLGGAWKALVQLRQRAPHKRTMLYLEQRLIAAGFEKLALDISPVRGGGLDFYFEDKSVANAFVQFVGALVPLRTRHSKKLVGADVHSNIPRLQHTLLADIAPVCKDDLVLPSRRASAVLGPCLPLVKRVTASLKLVNPATGAEVDVSTEAYWKAPLETLFSADSLTEFVVLDVETEEAWSKADERTGVAEAVIARVSDFGVNDETMTVMTHLGNVLHAGDTAFGYDLDRLNLPDDRRAALARAFGSHAAPDVVLIKKKREGKKKHRNRRLRRFYEPGEEATAEAGVGASAPAAPQVAAVAPEAEGKKKGKGTRRNRGADAEEREMSDFLAYLEHDDEMAAAVGLLPQAPQGEGAAPVQAEEQELLARAAVDELVSEKEGVQASPGLQQDASGARQEGQMSEGLLASFYDDEGDALEVKEANDEGQPTAHAEDSKS